MGQFNDKNNLLEIYSGTYCIKERTGESDGIGKGSPGRSPWQQMAEQCYTGTIAGENELFLPFHSQPAEDSGSSESETKPRPWACFLAVADSRVGGIKAKRLQEFFGLLVDTRIYHGSWGGLKQRMDLG